MAAQQFAFGETADRAQVLGRVLEFEDAQRARHFFQQARHVGKLGMVPVGLDERDEALASLREVGNGLLHQHLEHLAGLGGGQYGFIGRHGAGGTVVHLAQTGDLVVERRFHVKQCAGDVEQARFVRDALAADERVDGGALVLHHPARHAKAQHAQGVGHAVQRFHLVTQCVSRGIRRPQVQVKRILHAKQVFLDGHRDSGQQGAVAAAETAAGMGQLGIAGQVFAQTKHGPDFADTTVVGGGVRHEIKQLAGQFQRRIGAESSVAAFGQALDLALNLGHRLLERLGGFEGMFGESVERAGGDPEQAARMLGISDRDQLFADVGEVADGRGAVVVLEPAQQGALEKTAQHLGAALEFVHRQRLGRTGGGGWQWARKIRREQHRLRQTLLAARLAQLVEQRQQHDRDVAVAALQALEVVGQLHNAAHQRGVAGFAFGNPVFHQGAR